MINIRAEIIVACTLLFKQELSYRFRIARQVRREYIECM